MDFALGVHITELTPLILLGVNIYFESTWEKCETHKCPKSFCMYITHGTFNVEEYMMINLENG
jgi:hypothetical protein